MVRVGQISIDLVANTGQLLKPLRAAQRQVETFGSAIRHGLGGAIGGLQRMLTSTTAKLGMLTGGLGAGGLATYAIKQAMAYEDAATAYATFLASGEKAKVLLAQLQKFSDVTPFTAEQVQTAGRGLLAFGFAADSIIPTLQYLGDAAAGSQNDINELVNILGKVKSKGKLQLEELNRFTDRGIVLIPDLAKQMKVAEKDIYKLITAGKLGFPEVEKAIKSLNEEGGLFAGAMDNLSRTASGKLSTLQSAFDNAMRDIGKVLIEGLDLKGSMDRITAWIEANKNNIVNAVKFITAITVEAITAITGGLASLFNDAASGQQALQSGNARVASSFEGILNAIDFVIDGLATLKMAGQVALNGLSVGLSELQVQQRAMQQAVIDATPAGLFIDLGVDAMKERAAEVLRLSTIEYDKTMNEWQKKMSRTTLTEKLRATFKAAGNATGGTSVITSPAIAAPQFAGITEEAIEVLSDATGTLTEFLEGLAMPSNASADMVGALERGSQEAFKVISDTMKGGDVDKKQLKELEKQTKLLEKAGGFQLLFAEI